GWRKQRRAANNNSHKGFHLAENRLEERSIGNLVRLSFPCTEGGERLLSHHRNHLDRSCAEILSNFAVDDGIVEPDHGSVRGEISEVHARQTSPINCAQAHGTRLARGINLALLQFENT